MADDIDYRQYAGRVAFPRNPQDLLSTADCPACFAALTSTVCSACGLDLRHPDAARLYETSVAAAGSLDERVAIIGRMRYETAQAGAATRPVPDAQAGAAAPVVSIREPAPADALLNQRDTAADAPVIQRVESTTSVPRRSSVQVTLLIVGVSLLSVAAIFFLVYAFINFGIVWRSVIIGAITIAAFVVASLLRRRRLTATAEGISAFAVVLVYLDAYALRANDLFGAAGVHGPTYWGVTLVVTAIAFLVWHRTSNLRIPNLAGFATFAPGVGVLVGGLARDLDYGLGTFLVFASIAAAGLIHRWAARPGHPATAERVIVLATTVLALLLGLVFHVSVLRDWDWAPALVAAVLAAIAAAHVVALLARRTSASLDRTFAGVLAGFAGVAAAAAIGLSATRIESEPFLLFAPPVAAAAVALALDVAAHRSRAGILRRTLSVAGWSAAAVLLVALAAPLLLAAQSAAVAALRTTVPVWAIEPSDAVAAIPNETLWAVGALAAVTFLAAAAWAAAGRAGGMLRSPARSTAILWAAGATVVLAVPELRTQWLVFAGWLLVAAACLLALLVTRRREVVRPRHRAVLVTVMAAAGVLGYLLGWATTSTWWVGTLVVIGILVASRSLVTRPGAKAALLGSGIGLALLSVGSVADQLMLHVHTGLGANLADRAVLTAVAAVVVLLGSSIPDGAATALDRRVEFWVAGAASVVALPAATVLVTGLAEETRRSLLLPEYGTSLATALALLLALALWLGLRRNRALRVERTIAAIAAAPTLYLAVTAFVRLLGLPEFTTAVAPITAAMLAAAGSLLVTLARPTVSPRWARELGVALVGIPALVAAVRADDGLTWLVLLLAAVGVLLLAIDRDGLFTSRSPRHHLGWLALALATAGLWWRLSGDRVTELVPYVVPLSLALLLVAGLITATARREQPPRDTKAGALVTLGALLVTLLPLGVDSATGPLAPALWIFGISATLLIAGSAITGGSWVQWNADACALAGAIGVVVVSVGRAIVLPAGALERDGWLAAVFLALMVAAFLQARAHPNGDDRVRSIGSQALGLVAMGSVLALEIEAFTANASGGIRAFALVLLWCALHVIAFLVARAPLTRLLAWVAIGFAAVTAVTAVAADALHPVEVATLPIALALLATGAIRLATVATARSWPWLGPGIAALLVPSLAATLEDRPLWRLVGLGVLGVAVIVMAVVRRLQAPFVIGVAVVLIHGIATFLPQLRAAYEFLPWWLWLGAGGVLLIVLAARYEQRIRNLRSVAMKFAALR